MKTQVKKSPGSKARAAAGGRARPAVKPKAAAKPSKPAPKASAQKAAAKKAAVPKATASKAVAPALKPSRPAPKPTGRMRTGIRPPEPIRVAAPPMRAVAAPETIAQEKQQQAYEEGVRLFQEKKYERAETQFEKVQQGPNRALAHRAEVHLRICRQRLHPPVVKLQNVEDRYNYAVTLINTRRLTEADEHLQAALKLAPQADHLHYALAATLALQGNPQGAYERLKTAIDLHPRNRILARSDPDFAGVLGFPPMASLLHLGSHVKSV